MRKLILLACVAVSACASSRAASNSPLTPPVPQPAAGDQLTVPFSDSSRPGLLNVRLLNGSITVSASSGKAVIIRTSQRNPDRRSRAVVDGLRRIDTPSAGIRVEELDNVMTVRSTSVNRSLDLEIQVPAKTNLRLAALNGGDIEVSGVDGDIEVTNTNGGITLNSVSGSVVAYAMNRPVIASLRQVTAGKPLSFRSQNGNVDVTLPQGIKANATMRSGNGGIYSDFDVQLKPSEPVVEDSRSQGGRYRLRVDGNVRGAINGGGPELTLSTMNGSVYVRKGP